ncbi:hypothetical protein [Paenibacillus sp. L3-i20]|uniref:hypothetical protein n=1 Tax=Paenibacillus sp. L3-i20 TaxID=2905833 RepID=UPI001EE01413|nr:hypothetical protein [Paenibacillus sp. L3-i20]GKU76415.1 hypothetical protein L3i20_v208120 [Paenibacillus sp. L3-i20]
MSGFSIRLKLWLKLWLTSASTIILMLLFPIVAYVSYTFLSHSIASFTSVFYEKAALLFFVFIVQWCFSIDFDSKCYVQLLTYPIARWKLVVERIVLSLLLFIGLLAAITIVLTLFAGGFVGKALLFSIPIYVGMAGIVVLATIIGRHSLGGLFAGLVIWILFLDGDALWHHASISLLHLPIVFEELSGGNGLFAPPNEWILYNRLFYMSLGVILWVIAIRQIERD